MLELCDGSLQKLIDERFEEEMEDKGFQEEEVLDFWNVHYEDDL